MALRLAKLRGARKIYAAARSHSVSRIETALAFGADEIIYTDKTPLESYPFERGGVDRVLVSAPPSTIPSAFKAARTGGVIGFIGIEYGAGANITFDANEFHFKAAAGIPRDAGAVLPECIELLKSGRRRRRADLAYVRAGRVPGRDEGAAPRPRVAIKMVMVLARGKR